MTVTPSRSLLLLLGGSLCLALLLTAAPARAQQPSGWSEPRNLSRSGAATEPLLLGGETWQAFWMDPYDGLTRVRRAGSVWGDPTPVPLSLIKRTGDGPLEFPVTARPNLFQDSREGVHALWLDTLEEQARPQAVLPQALLHSRLANGAPAWTDPVALAPSAAAAELVEAADGTLHLFFLRPLQEPELPAGLYYRRSADGGATWSAPQRLYGSVYLRLLTPEEAHVQAAAAPGGALHVMWDDPRQGRAFYAHSPDGGLTWAEPEALGLPGEEARRGQVVVTGAGAPLRLWEATDTGGACGLVQQESDAATASWSEPVRVLGGVIGCPSAWRLLPLPDGGALWVAGEGGDSLQLAAWNGEAWSEPKQVPLSFPAQSEERTMHLTAARVALRGEALGLVGLGQEDGELWFLESLTDAVEWVWTPPPPWAAPTPLSQSTALPGPPAVAMDAAGRAHVLWSESPAEGVPQATLLLASRAGQVWSPPVRVAVVGEAATLAAENQDGQPALVAVGEQLHMVWRRGPDGQLWYARAASRDVGAGWTNARPLPQPPGAGCCAAIARDAGGRLHVVYAVPLNEARGIYYTRSGDGGLTWTEAVQLFDATAAGWTTVTRPQVAVDEQGAVHVVWVRGGLSGIVPAQGIFYARSADGAQWSAPRALAEGAYDWPLLVTSGTGRLHLVWKELERPGDWLHRRSDDGGAGWSRAGRLLGFTGVVGPASLLAGGEDTLYLLGVAPTLAGQSSLRLSRWNGSRWLQPETLELALAQPSGLAAALEPTVGRLVVALPGTTEQEGVAQTGVWASDRPLPAVAVTPVATFTPQSVPTTTPVPTPLPTATPVPTLDLTTTPPPAGDLNAGAPLLLSALLAAGIITGVLVVRVVWR